MRLVGKWRVLVESKGTDLLPFPWRRKSLTYLLDRLFAGERVAEQELERFGITVRELSERDEVITVPPEEWQADSAAPQE